MSTVSFKMDGLDAKINVWNALREAVEETVIALGITVIIANIAAAAIL